MPLKVRIFFIVLKVFFIFELCYKIEGPVFVVMVLKISVILGLEYRGVPVRVGDMEEEAVGSDEVCAESEVLGVPPTPFHRACHAPHAP